MFAVGYLLPCRGIPANVRTDRVIEARRLDLVIVNKQENCKIIDDAIPKETKVNEKLDKKVEKYQDLARAKVISIVMSALPGTVPKRLPECLRTIRVGTPVEPEQTTALSGSSRILGKVLEVCI